MLAGKGVPIMRSRETIVAALGTAVACLYQLIDLFRHFSVLLDDQIAIGRYIATINGLAFLAIVFYVRWKKGRRQEHIEGKRTRSTVQTN
jgi:hypothetical protein